MSNPKISVAMAAYNGEEYIEEQVKSILNQTRQIDELIISDDGSKDRTIEILKKINDKRIKIVNGPRNGIKKNFENAIKNTTGEIIFLADQDDIWEKDKVKIVLKNLKGDEVTLVVHNACIVDKDLKSINLDSFGWRKSKAGVVKNVIKNSYIGCCMAFKREVLKYILPIPDTIEMHDQWIGIINEKKCGKSLFIRDKLIKYRRHENNSSNMSHHPISVMIKNRLNFVKALKERVKK